MAKRYLPQITNIQIVDSVEDVYVVPTFVTYCNSGAVGDPNTYPLVKRGMGKTRSVSGDAC